MEIPIAIGRKRKEESAVITKKGSEKFLNLFLLFENLVGIL
jgi:hypothetical protein